VNLSSKFKFVLSLLLSFVLLATGCTAQWISVALSDLPVLTQMALNIATIVTSLQAGKQLSASDAAAIQNISTEASNDLNLLQSLYNEYKASPSQGTIQQIQNVISDINQNLPALLQASHVSDATLSARITAAVNLILTTVDTFSSLIPQTSSPANAMAVVQKRSVKVSVPSAKDLKKQWNEQVCAPTGKPAFDAAFAFCTLT